MLLTRLKDSDIDTRISYVRSFIKYKYNIKRTYNTISVQIKRVKVPKGKNKKKVNKFNANILLNEDGTDTLLLIPYDKIKVTPFKDKRTKSNKFSVEKSDFFIGDTQIYIDVLGQLNETHYVCKFNKGR